MDTGQIGWARKYISGTCCSGAKNTFIEVQGDKEQATGERENEQSERCAIMANNTATFVLGRFANAIQAAVLLNFIKSIYFKGKM